MTNNRALNFTLMSSQTEQAYCVKCKGKQDIVEGKEEIMKNGKRVLKGKCKTCGTKVNRILKSIKPVPA